MRALTVHAIGRQSFGQLHAPGKTETGMWLFVALVVVPLIEIGLFIEVGGLLGLWPTLAIVVLTAVLGAALLRRQGLAALADLEGRLRRGQDPVEPVVHGLLILIAGIVLLTPGFFTDAIGFSLLVRPVRSALIRRLGRRIAVAGVSVGRQAGAGPGPPPAGGETIETEYEDVTDARGPRTGRPSGWTER